MDKPALDLDAARRSFDETMITRGDPTSGFYGGTLGRFARHVVPDLFAEVERLRGSSEAREVAAPWRDDELVAYCRCSMPPIYHAPKSPQCDYCHKTLARANGQACEGYRAALASPAPAPADEEKT